MTAHPAAVRPEDMYDAVTIAGFRAAGYWRDDTLSGSVDRLAAERPDRVLITDGYAALTAAELRGQAYRLAAALLRLGVRAGDRVQVQLPNWNEFIVVYVALARIGAVLVPTMPIYRHDEVLYVLRHSGAKVSVVAAEFRGFDYPDMLQDIRASAPDLRHVISVRGGEPDDPGARGAVPEQVLVRALGARRLLGLRVPLQGDRPPDPPDGGVSGVDPAVDHGHGDPGAGRTAPGPFLVDGQTDPWHRAQRLGGESVTPCGS